MAKNTGNKRNKEKWVRDRAKKAYEKEDTCYICSTTEDLELHHTHSVTKLIEAWASQKGYDVDTDDGILEVRDEFIAEHQSELFDQVYTLCNKHHVKLHSIFGKSPENITVPKQSKWIEIQRSKANGTYTAPVGSFAAFC